MWHHKPCPKVLPAVVHPTQCNVNEKVCEYIVPEVHPVHTKNITYHNYKHVHSFPQTVSNENVVTNQQFVSPASPVAGATYGPSGPVLGAQMGPGGPVMGAQMGPGFGKPMYGGPVMGSQMGPMGKPWGHKGCGC